ncbi:hypothetical protein N7528_005768 [Penicillium herquei]|nr:hypothetical protein N7528_005768 [Penicillium herquei]
MDPDEPRKRIKMEEDKTIECLDLIPYNFRQGDVNLHEALIDLKERLSGLLLSMGLSEFITKPNSTLHKLSMGFIGDSGVGKSSVINSLLDQTELAQSNGDGAACTSVVTEFRSTDSAHPDPYTIEIEFMESEEIKELLEELLRNFRAFYCPLLYSNVTSKDARESIKLAGERARQTFESLFHDRTETIYELLGDESENNWDSIINMLETWAGEVLAQRPDQIRDSVAVVTTNDLQSCKDYLDHLMTSSHENGDLVLWPFINLIRVYIRSPVLQTGLVVADLPGFRDMNYARVRATERYLFHQCDEVFIVSDISRCITDQSIMEIRNRCSIIPQQIVCTRSEEIIPEEAARGQTPHHLQVQSMNSEIREIRRKLRDTLVGMKNASSESMKSKFAIEQADLTLKIEELELERTEYLVNHRNARVEKQLKRKHDDTGVFCVSNKLYSEHSMDPESPYLALSGIRQLRHHCQLLPAASQLRLLTEYLQNQIPALLSSIVQWTLAGSDIVATEQATALQKSLDEVESGFRRDLLSNDGYLKGTKTALKKSFKKMVLRLIEKSAKPWTKKCERVSDEWAKWHHSTYGAFCRANGTHKRKYRGREEPHCWNTELLDVSRGKLEPIMDEVISQLRQKKNVLKGEVSKVFDGGCTMLRDHEEDAPISIGNMIPNIETRKTTLTQQVESTLTKMIESIRKLSFDMLEGHASSFMVTIMRPTYLKCANEGEGDAKIHEKKRIFAKYKKLAKKAHDKVLEEHFPSLESRFEEQIERIVRDLSTIVVEKGRKSEAEQDLQLTDEIIIRAEEAKRVLETAQEALEKGKDCE